MSEPTLVDANTPGDLERFFQFHRKLIEAMPKKRMRKRSMEALRLAVEAKGWLLVTMDPRGWRVPRIKQRGHSFTVQIPIDGVYVTYKTGHWGNGPGYRWVRHHLVEWVKTTGKYRKRDVADSVVEWVLYGMPHRALQRLR